MAKVIVSIDFGTSTTSYSYSFNNPNEIIAGSLSDTGERNPTEIIYNDLNGKILAFGLKCIEYLQNNELGQLEYYFKDIKMSLYKGKETIEDQEGKQEHKTQKVISKILLYIKNHAIKTFADQGYSFTSEDIHL